MTIDELLASAMAPARSRTMRYMARVDEHLRGMNDDDRAAFLKSELRKWQQRYSTWAKRIDNGTASESELSQNAFDYTETIGTLAKRIAKVAA